MASMFNKRHYEAIATTMQRAHPRGDEPSLDILSLQWRLTVEEFSNMFGADNGLFKREQFEQACEPGANVKART